MDIITPNMPPNKDYKENHRHLINTETMKRALSFWFQGVHITEHLSWDDDTFIY